MAMTGQEVGFLAMFGAVALLLTLASGVLPTFGGQSTGAAFTAPAKTKNIGGAAYTVPQLPPTQAAGLLHCTDRDGNNPYRGSEVFTWYGSGIVREAFADHCSDDHAVEEQLCDATGQPFAAKVPCPAGCLNGACLPVLT